MGAVVVAVSGCSADGQPSTDIALPEKDMARWVMPLDRYMPSSNELLRESYADSLVLQACLNGKGFERAVPPPSSVTYNINLVREVFDETRAAQYGYARPRDVDELDAYTAYRRLVRSDTETAALQECASQLDGEIPRFTNHQMNFGNQMAQSAFMASIEAPAVKEAAGRWRECMRPQGIEDLPEDPGFMPTNSIRQRLRTGDEPEQQIIVSQEEKDIAVFDARCRASSGYEETRYEEEWKRQLALLSDNGPALDALRAGIDDVNAKIEAVIAKNAPAS